MPKSVHEDLDGGFHATGLLRRKRKPLQCSGQNPMAAVLTHGEFACRYTGVTFLGNAPMHRYQATIGVSRMKHYLGIWATAERAAYARDVAVLAVKV